VKRIVAAFPEAAGFGIGTKLSSEVKNVAGVIFKACMIDGRPTLKASNSLDKTTLPGSMQVFRGFGCRRQVRRGRNQAAKTNRSKFPAPLR